MRSFASRQAIANHSCSITGPSHTDTQSVIDAEQALTETEGAWREWSERSSYQGRWRDPVTRSLITLKALTYKPTGGLIAAPTTSLPEYLGGVRNWDYRYCWLRDATFTLNALLLAGYVDEAAAWREWLLRAIAGSPDDLQILYGVTGVRRLDEYEVAWLPGYEGSAPVRIGNAAAKQFQLDVYGEVMDTLHLARMSGLPPEPEAWKVQVGFAQVSRVALGIAGRGFVGGAGTAAAFYAFQGHGLGCIRPRHQGRGAGWARRPHRALAAAARGDPCADLRQRI